MWHLLLNRDCFEHCDHQQEFIHISVFGLLFKRLRMFRCLSDRCQFVIDSSCMHTGALSCLLHPQRWQRPGAPAHSQHLHEPAQAARVLRPAPDEEQTFVCHRVICRVWAELRRAEDFSASALMSVDATLQKWLGKKGLETKESEWCTGLSGLLCVCHIEGLKIIMQRMRKKGCKVFWFCFFIPCCF